MTAMTSPTAATRFETLDWYETPKYYDIVFDVDTSKEADFLAAIYERYAGTRGKRVLEPACGSGRLLVELARRGWSVTGDDRSQPMLAYARERLDSAGLVGTLRRNDMADFHTRGRFDLAHCFVSTFKYLLTEKAARAHLECIARALKPGGVYALGFHLTDYAATGRTRERWVAQRGDTRVVCNIQGWPADRRRRLEQVRARLVIDEGGVRKRSETTWNFRTYDASQVRRLLRSVPALEHVATYDFRYDADECCRLSDAQYDTLLILRRRE
ncbi:MAG: class I SAM-dependent methyltransferase [Planctomycetota bacterium]|nr:MAG: class I SAM-dependent methyltransferase [Planctomycetota bacterium]